MHETPDNNMTMKMTKTLLAALTAIALLAGCGDSNTQNRGAKSPPTVSLQEAAASGDVDAVRQHIAAGSNLNEQEPMGGGTPLIAAAAFGQTEVAKALIKGGANLNARNNDGATALITAAFFCHADILQALLDAGADKNLKNKAGATALQSVEAPFEQVRGIYDYIGTVLAPAGLKLDYARIQAERPKIAALLR